MDISLIIGAGHHSHLQLGNDACTSSELSCHNINRPSKLLNTHTHAVKFLKWIPVGIRPSHPCHEWC